MVIESGTVCESSDGTALVEMDCHSVCGTCSGYSTCEAKDRRSILSMVDNIGVRSGDLVEFEIPSRRYYVSLFAVFIFPLLVLLCVYLLTFWLSGDNGISVILSLVGFLSSFVVVRIYGQKIDGDASSKPRVVRVIKRCKSGILKKRDERI